MTLDEAVACLPPEQDVLVLIVEDIVALISNHGQHSVTFVLVSAYHGDEQHLPGPAGLDQHPSLEEDVVLTVSIAVIGIGPVLHYAPML